MLDINAATQLLSPKERDVFFLALTSMNTREMAKEMKVSEAAIRFHLASIYKKTNSNGRRDLLLKFMRTSPADQNLMVFVHTLVKKIDELNKSVEELERSILPGLRRVP